LKRRLRCYEDSDKDDRRSESSVAVSIDDVEGSEDEEEEEEEGDWGEVVESGDWIEILLRPATTTTRNMRREDKAGISDRDHKTST